MKKNLENERTRKRNIAEQDKERNLSVERASSKRAWSKTWIEKNPEAKKCNERRAHVRGKVRDGTLQLYCVKDHGGEEHYVLDDRLVSRIFNDVPEYHAMNINLDAFYSNNTTSDSRGNQKATLKLHRQAMQSGTRVRNPQWTQSEGKMNRLFYNKRPTAAADGTSKFRIGADLNGSSRGKRTTNIHPTIVKLTHLALKQVVLRRATDLFNGQVASVLESLMVNPNGMSEEDFEGKLWPSTSMLATDEKTKQQDCHYDLTAGEVDSYLSRLVRRFEAAMRNETRNNNWRVNMLWGNLQDPDFLRREFHGLLLPWAAVFLIESESKGVNLSFYKRHTGTACEVKEHIRDFEKRNSFFQNKQGDTATYVYFEERIISLLMGHLLMFRMDMPHNGGHKTLALADGDGDDFATRYHMFIDLYGSGVTTQEENKGNQYSSQSRMSYQNCIAEPITQQDLNGCDAEGNIRGDFWETFKPGDLEQ